MIVKINGAVLEDKPLIDKYSEALEATYKEIESKNREIRRSKPMKKVLTLLGLIAPLGLASVAHASTLASNPMLPIEQNLVGDWIMNRMKQFFTIEAKGGVLRQDSVIWHMNDWLQKTMLNTQDFFDNGEVLSIFNAIWTICMSFVLLIIGKKGFDMVKSRALGTTSLGGTELIIRLLASVVMTFLSLDIMQLGIHGSNLVIKTLFKAIETHLIPYQVLEQTNSIGLIFWFIGFCFMTVILAIQYWVRQITVAILGVLTPVANMSWVVDGGAMLGTLIREFITLITTPLVHGIILAIGSVFMLEVTTMTGNAWIDGFNSIMIGFSTMFLMVVTPSFLRKFTTGSVNPFKSVASLGKGVAGNATKLMKLFK